MGKLNNSLPTLQEVITYVHSKDKSMSISLISKAYDIIEKINKLHGYDFKEGVYEHSKVLRLMSK